MEVLHLCLEVEDSTGECRHGGRERSGPLGQCKFFHWSGKIKGQTLKASEGIWSYLRGSREPSNEEGSGTPLQYSCPENPMDGGAWWAAVHGAAKSRTRLSHFTFTFHFPALEKEMAAHSSVLAWRIPGTGEPGGLPLWDRTESGTTEAI